MDVAQRAGVSLFEDSIPSRGCYNVLIDDACHDYDWIVQYIRQHSDPKRLAFHIFADRHSVVISPKMSRS